jgi:hypothetical protein
MSTSRLLRSAAVGALLLAVPAAAHAQLGGLAKRAAQRALEKKAEQTVTQPATSRSDDSPACRNVTFDRTTVELTGARLDGIVKALDAANAGPNGVKRRELRSRIEAAEARLDELRNDESLQKAEESQREYKSCRQEAFSEIVNKRVEAEGQGIMTKYAQAMRVHNEKIAAAQQKGDTAKANALQDSTWQVMMTVVTPTAADSAIVQKKCGNPPRVSRRVAERDSLAVAVRELNDELRAMDEDAEDAMLEASGLTATQLAMARERLTMYVKQNRTCGYTKAEMDAIDARRADLEKLL